MAYRKHKVFGIRHKETKEWINTYDLLTKEITFNSESYMSFEGKLSADMFIQKMIDMDNFCESDYEIVEIKS